MDLLSLVKSVGAKIFGETEKIVPSGAGNIKATEKVVPQGVGNIKATEKVVPQGADIEATEKVVPQGADIEATEKVVSQGAGNIKATEKVVSQGAGNIEAIEKVVMQGGDNNKSKFYTVQSGDTLWNIAEAEYGPGQGGGYHLIFAANKPLLSDPDAIYPGQVLRIPPLAV